MISTIFDNLIRIFDNHTIVDNKLEMLVDLQQEDQQFFFCASISPLFVTFL